jgi:hypothetical protein
VDICTSNEETQNIAEECKQECEKLKKKLEKEEEARLQPEYKYKTKNLKIHRIPENTTRPRKDEESTTRQAIENMTKKQLELNNVYIDSCYRLGPKMKMNPNNLNRKPRPILVSFGTFRDQNVVWDNKHRLKGTKTMLREDLPTKMEENV